MPTSQSHPPLVPEGEEFENLPELLKNISSRWPILAVAFSPDGKIIASGSRDATLRLWDAASGKLLKTLQGHTDFVTSVSFSPDGKTIASGSDDKTLRLWDAASGKHLKTLQGHTGWVHSVSFSPDGKTIASGSWDTTLRLWDVASGKLLKTLQGHTRPVYSVSFSPDGKTIASGSGAGALELHKAADGKSLWTFITGQNGSWLYINAADRVWRGDDGTFLLKKDKNGNFAPVPPKTKGNGTLDVRMKPNLLETHDGEAVEFQLKLENTGNGWVYWINVVHDTERPHKNPLIFHPPPTRIKLAPGETAAIPCKVSAKSDYFNPGEQSSILYLKITTAYGLPIPLEIPVNIHVPQLQLLKTELQNQERPLLLISLRYLDKQDLEFLIEFEAKIEGRSLGLYQGRRRSVEEAFGMTFPIPEDLDIEKGSTFNLRVRKQQHPVHVWELNNIPISLPIPPWYWYILFALLFLGSGIGAYYLRLYLHPLVTRLSKSPESFMHLEPQQFPRAKHLLKRTRRLETVLSTAAISQSRLEKAITFFQQWDSDARGQYLFQRLEMTGQPVPAGEIGIDLFKLQVKADFILNMDQCLVAFPPEDMPAHEILTQIKKVDMTHYMVCIFITANGEQQTELRKTSLNTGNLYVTPGTRELNALLLSPSPLEAFARLIASQVKVTRISPFQIKGGVDKEIIFFGREQLLTHIVQREPGNYLLVGGRQLGKSSLLKAIKRRYRDHPSIQCFYLVLTGPEIASHLAGALDLPADTTLPRVLEHMRRGPKQLFLIDEADKFIAGEARTGCTTLQHFRSLSEEGKCWFIFAGFWDLYHSVTFDYQSPIKNFGETLTIEALEADACRRLASIPMGFLNIRYETGELVETLLQETGRRANLIAIVCNEVLKQLDMTDRVIRPGHLEAVLDSDAVRSALSGWETLTTDDASNRLDRIIVYATIGKETFSLAELMGILETKGRSYEPEQVKQSLARLELAFILKREKQTYTFRVPLFKKMVLEQEPGILLEGELKHLQDH